MGLPNPSMSFTPFDILTAQEMNDLVENDQALAAGTGFNTGAIPTAALANSSVTAAKIDLTTLHYKSTNVTSNFSSASTTSVLITGATLTFTVPSGGGTYKFVFTAGNSYISNGANMTISIWDGAVGSGTIVVDRLSYFLAGQGTPTYVEGYATLSAGSHTIRASMKVSAFTGTIEMSATNPGYVTADRVA